MNCHDFNSQWIELVYGELEPGDAARCREHAAACSACAAALAALDETQRVLDELPPQQTRVDLARLCLKLSAQSRRARARRLWGGASAAAIVLVAVGLVWAAVGVDVAPGRVVLAWRAAQGERLPDGLPPSRESPAASGQESAGEPNVRLADANSSQSGAAPSDSLAAARERYLRSGRYLSQDSTYLDARDRVIALGLDGVPRTAFAAPLAERSSSSPPSYQELRKQLLSSGGLPRPST